MAIHESGENYLETILLLDMQNGHTRSIDVANHMNVSKPSVSRAMSILRESGCIVMEDDGRLVLTPAGRGIAERIYERHKVLTDFLQSLGVSAVVAAEDACLIEHDLSEESFKKICDFVKKGTLN